MHVEMPERKTTNQRVQRNNAERPALISLTTVIKIPQREELLDYRSKSELDPCGQMTFNQVNSHMLKIDVQQIQKYLPPQNSPKHIQLSLCHPGHGTKAATSSTT